MLKDGCLPFGRRRTIKPVLLKQRFLLLIIRTTVQLLIVPVLFRIRCMFVLELVQRDAKNDKEKIAQNPLR